MIDLPTGTVTFLYTDIEGSAELAQQYPAALPALLARHHAILREAIQARQGVVYRMLGDAFCAAFSTPEDAFAAALTAQRALQHEAWSPARIKVRMGLHTGTALPELDGDAKVMVVNGGPHQKRSFIRSAFRVAIAGASESVTISSPYFIPGPRVVRSLLRAARRGIRIQRQQDHGLVIAASLGAGGRAEQD